MRMAALMAWLVACCEAHNDGSEEVDHDPRHFERPTCTDATHDAPTNIISAREDRSNMFSSDPASYPREIENRRETISPVIINDDAPMAAEARRIMLSSSSTLKNAQARLAASAQAAGANDKAEPSRCHYRGLLEKGNPREQPTPMAKDDQPRQGSWKWDPAGQEHKATRQWQRTEPPSTNLFTSRISAGCGIQKAPCFWKTSNFYKQFLLLLCAIAEYYIHSGEAYGLYNMLNTMVQYDMYLYRGSIEKCCDIIPGCYSTTTTTGQSTEGQQAKQLLEQPSTTLHPSGILANQTMIHGPQQQQQQQQQGQFGAAASNDYCACSNC